MTENIREVDNFTLVDIIDAWGRGFNPHPDMLGPVARDLLRARGYTKLLCSLCGENTLIENHKCNPKWRNRK